MPRSGDRLIIRNFNLMIDLLISWKSWISISWNSTSWAWVKRTLQANKYHKIYYSMINWSKNDCTFRAVGTKWSKNDWKQDRKQIENDREMIKNLIECVFRAVQKNDGKWSKKDRKMYWICFQGCSNKMISFVEDHVIYLIAVAGGVAVIQVNKKN